MSSKKKTIRKAFREAVFARDHYRCVVCESPGMDRQGGNEHKRFHNKQNPCELDAHHITNRNQMLHGGYVPENGISLCPHCHIEAEDQVLFPEHLYEIIGSSLEKAEEASKRLA